MANGTFLKYQAAGVAELLRGKSLAVPAYQRSYSWASEPNDRGEDKIQVAEFWEDLQSSFNNQSAYFLGTVVLASGESEKNSREMVIDGQQRLATASLLLAAIRDRYAAGGEQKSADTTQQDYLGRFDKKAKRDLPKLILNTDDRDFYEKRVVGGELIEAGNFSQGLIDAAYRYLRKCIDTFATAHGSEWESKLNELESWLEQGVQVIAITVPTEADAYLISKPLTIVGPISPWRIF